MNIKEILLASRKSGFLGRIRTREKTGPKSGSGRKTQIRHTVFKYCLFKILIKALTPGVCILHVLESYPC